MKKKCPKCNQSKELKAFSKDKTTKDGLQVYCKSCWANIHRKRAYNLSFENYNKMLIQQGGVCAICKNQETAIHRNTKETKRLAIDHDHKTGKIRGLLCSRCNNMLGFALNSPNTLANAISYLTKETKP